MRDEPTFIGELVAELDINSTSRHIICLMPRYTAAQLRKLWKPRLAQHGFNCGSYFCREAGNFQQVIGFQRNLHNPTIRVNLQVLLRDEFLNPPANFVMLSGALTRDQALFGRDFWWEEDEVSNSVECAVHYAIPFLEYYSNSANLIPLFERGVEKKCQIAALVNPPSPPALLKKQLPGALENLPARVPPIHFHVLSLLYYYDGRIGESCKNANRYLETLGQTRFGGEPERTLRQLAAMGCAESIRKFH